MHTSNNSQRRLTRRTAGLGIGLALVASAALGTQSFASDDDEGDSSAPPGVPISADDLAVASGDFTLAAEPLIQTGGATFDSAILSKFIPAHGFQVHQGGGNLADLADRTATTCLEPSAGSAGVLTRLSAPVELPDGARIKQIAFYGTDAEAAVDATITLNRTEFTTQLSLAPNPPVSAFSTTEIDSFSTDGDPGTSVFFGTDNLEELVGTPNTGPFGATSFPNRFHTIDVTLPNLDPATTSLCGVKVLYQIPEVANAGVVFHPIDPVRAFDSRRATFADAGQLAPGTSKTISIADGYDSDGIAIAGQADSVPANATAIAYNITVAGATGPNFVAVTAGDATEFTASSINYVGGSNIANAGTVTIAADRTITLWGGDNVGSAHTLIDITGYYAPAVLPNMAN